jgi:hypothetical protein
MPTNAQKSGLPDGFLYTKNPYSGICIFEGLGMENAGILYDYF